MFLVLILLHLLSFIEADNVRHKRYLVYPDGGPARAQVHFFYLNESMQIYIT